MPEMKWTPDRYPEADWSAPVAVYYGCYPVEPLSPQPVTISTTGVWYEPERKSTMWGAIATALSALVPALVQIWGPPSPVEWDALVKACEPLPSPGPADKVLAEIEADRAATTVKVPVTGKDVAP